MQPKLPCDLGGLSVLVTRPVDQAEGLCDLIAAVRGRPVRFPTLEILGPPDKHAVRAELSTIANGDLLIFISANAVRYSFPLLPDRVPLDLAIAAVGTATARSLSEHGLDPTIVPQRMDSEGLLAEAGLQSVAGRRVFILCGNQGREMIQNELTQRGAEVRRVEVYRRQRPERRAAAQNLVAGWPRLVDTVVATSNDILDNLFAMLGADGHDLVRATPLVVISQRMAEHAIGRGCERVHVAASARDQDVLATLCEIESTISDTPGV
jgi:uroporphyrinogen-III synthase